MLAQAIQPYHVVLVSQSPRRRELLKGLEINFEATSVDADETYPAHLKGAEVPCYITQVKAHAYKPLLQDNTLAITADTVVSIDGYILGKPNNKAEAMHMLRTLSGKKHQVITAVCVFTKQKEHLFYAVSEVYFKPLLDQEIEHYIDTYQPFDKAGSYGVQEWIGYIGIEKIVGSYYNVMGLPIQRLYQELINFLALK
ncbi:MAG: Maf family nucleotide pyrophosphatase [Paludibacteraceae bacterium]|nr:Maf family nucleotide pyrophosphatase [Paludibacteraceae bacterium]